MVDPRPAFAEPRVRNARDRSAARRLRDRSIPVEDQTLGGRSGPLGKREGDGAVLPHGAALSIRRTAFVGVDSV
jgi:hypothetical protein